MIRPRVPLADDHQIFREAFRKLLESGGKSRGADARLTPRQREVLQLLVEGHTMKKVAEILNVTPRTVAYHKYRMMEELKLKSSAALVQHAIRKGIISP
jgi:DNA-binding NarL/FixJ family response regulator